ncbi:MAG: MATE family efflux transporter [Oscillospiraceae bacterium]|nr:MATE family efflux transporter [Oscillospiraceae bacterium]
MVKDKQFYKSLARIAAPAAFQGFISILNVQIDNIMVSSLGDTVFSAVGQVNSATAFFIAVIGGLVGGSSVLVSQYWGRKNTKAICSVFAIVSQLCLALAAVMVSLVWVFPRGVLSALTDKADIIEAAMPYLKLVSLSYLPLAISTAFIGMLRCVEVVAVSLYTSVAALFINIGLNYLLIFGKFGFPAMGVQGAAIATICSRAAELLVIYWYAFHKQKNLPIKPRDLLAADGVLWRDYGRYGLPVGITDTLWALVGLCKTMIIGRLSASFISAMMITTGLMELGRVFSSSLTVGACVLIGKSVGEGDLRKTRRYSDTIQILFVGVGLLIASSVFLLRNIYPTVLFPDVSQEARALSRQFLAIGAATLIGTTYHASCFVGINRGAGDSRFVMFVDFIAGWLIVLPLSYLSVFVWHSPLPITFLMLYIDQCFKWIIAFLRLRGDKWIRNVTRS